MPKSSLMNIMVLLVENPEEGCGNDIISPRIFDIKVHVTNIQL
jgi:hypothetical protein